MRGHKLLFGASAMMVLGFGIHVLIDYSQYDGMFHSAPFRLWVYVDALLWLVPAALALAAGLVAKKKLIDKERKK